jgi:alpha/beta superfamily hydrolase
MARAFERPATIALPDEPGREGLALEGLWVPAPDSATGGAVIAPPHPMMGGSMESPVVTEIAHACGRAGLHSLRFNWRGVGASAGLASSEPEVADVDYAAAMAFLGDTVAPPYVACGYSFGSLAALRATRQDPLPSRLVLIAPVTSMLEAELLLDFPGEIFMAVGQHDEWADARALSELAVQSHNARVEVIPDCDHFFMSGLGPLGRAISEWWDEIASA